ncbi:hypothetical protein [Flaviaesturariibacter aridisoli]|uniref:DUF4252 domain-containing protein n=1 Tax=Flaviaesturariibacter aridisoli TaxID=2545761 RepID=A0A4R4E129_9BACT|nr:hypothetical protein [Flaviaesturariibacter aridisoli]TCZ73086.1 hypothetical protein E0486_06955 [Flaviaesturariibacter aridisoli]
MKKILFLLLLVSGGASAQRLTLTDLLKLSESRKDTAFVFRYIRQRGFNVRGRTDDGNAVLMGDRDKSKTRFTEMVFVSLSGNEAMMFQYGTRSTDNFAAIRRQIAEDGSFNALPSKDEAGERIETYSSREYLIAIETVAGQSHYVISIRPKERPRMRQGD